jgi:hypothetical protein
MNILPLLFWIQGLFLFLKKKKKKIPSLFFSFLYLSSLCFLGLRSFFLGELATRFGDFSAGVNLDPTSCIIGEMIHNQAIREGKKK